jgi:hypothetical protein
MHKNFFARGQLNLPVGRTCYEKLEEKCVPKITNYYF